MNSRRKLKDSLASYLNEFKYTVYNDANDDLKRFLYRCYSGYFSPLYSLLEKQANHDICYGNRVLVNPNVIVILYFVFSQWRGDSDCILYLPAY